MVSGTPGAERKQVTQRVTLVGAVANVVLSIGKVAAGFWGNSQSLIADGIHSLSDLLSDGLVYFAAGRASQAPDSDHPYGHGRFETLATLGLGVLLALVGAGIVWDAASRLFDPQRLLVPGVVALVGAGASILIKEWLYHYTKRAALRIRSDMLRANAWHHRSDAVSSVVVLVGVAGTMAGLPYLDAIAAALVGLMILHIAWALAWPALRELTDAGLEVERVKKIHEVIIGVSGVKAVHMLRTRSLGGQASVDVHVLVQPLISVSEGHMIGQTVIDRLEAQIDEVSDVTVHVDPEDDEVGTPCSGLPLRQEAEALLTSRWQDVPAASRRKRVLLHYLDGRIEVDLYLPLGACAGEAEVRRLRTDLQDRLADLPAFGQVRVFYG